MVRVTVPVPGRPYDVVVGRGLIEDPGAYAVPGSAERAFALADRTVGDRWFPPLAEALAERGVAAVWLPVPVGDLCRLVAPDGSQSRSRGGPADVWRVPGGSTAQAAGWSQLSP